jgi:hypothetical protein
MDLKNLENLLCQCVDPSDPEHVRAKEAIAKHAQEIGWDHVEALMYHDLSKKVQEELESLSFYQDYKGCFVNQENGGYGFHPSMVAPDLVHISFKRSVEAAVTYFKKMVSLPYADGYSTILLLGLDLETSFEVYPGVTLTRIEDLPSSNSKEHYVGDDNKWHFNSPHSSFVSAPKCALVRKIRIEPLIYCSGNEPENKKPLESDELFKDIALLLTLVGPSPVLTSVHWFEFEDQDIQGVNPSGGGWYNYEIFPITLPNKNLPVADESIGNTISLYFNISDSKVKKRVAVALERLSASLRRRNPGDSALELSIALEIIFAEDYGENTFKIGLRAALLLSDEVAQRKRIRSVISSLYKQRSKLVHKGENSDIAKIKDFSPVSSVELIREAADYVSKAIKKILELGCIPDWNEYELKTK